MTIKVLDTNVILEHSLSGILDQLNGAEEGNIRIVIPYKVTRELNSFKKGNDLINYNARKSIKFIEELRGFGSLLEGVDYNSKFSFQIFLSEGDEQLNSAIVDEDVILTALNLQRLNKTTNVEILTEDIDERILADIWNVNSRTMTKIEKDDLYTGIEEIRITERQAQELCQNNLFKTSRRLLPNQFIKMEDPIGGIHYGIYKAERSSIESLKSFYNAWGIKPKKKNGHVITEQGMLMHLLLDPNINFVSAIGPSGTGKTLLAIACGLEQTLKLEGIYEKVVIMRPLSEVDKDIGALPGDKMEKLEPWLASAFDNLEFLLDKYTLKECEIPGLSAREKTYSLIDMGKLELEAMAYIRGRSIANQYIIVDDAQNLTPHQAATIITRAGEGSKVVFLGDISSKQIDNKKVNSFSNGLTYTVENLKGSDPIVGHITLKEVVRSKLATLGVELL